MLDRRRRRGFSLIELLIVITIILLIISIAAPKYRQVQMLSRETAALSAIRTIQTMQVQYESQFGRFATKLEELGPPTSGTPSAAGAALIGSDLSQGLNKGYKYTMTAVPGGYQITAIPVVFGSDGNRAFYSDQTMEIRVKSGGPATADSDVFK